MSLPAAHCDNIDFLPGEYPQSRGQATDALLNCVNQLRGRFAQGADSAPVLLDAQGQIVPDQVTLDPECRFGEATSREAADSRAKCRTLEGLGRVLPGAQDFYAHSNWADTADPTRPVGVDNPPGLNLPGPSPVLDLRAEATPDVPPDLSGGCYALRDQVPGVGECEQRVTHAVLNKDRGLIDPATGDATAPTTPRGLVEDNFAKAVAGAVAETRRQWRDFSGEDGLDHRLVLGQGGGHPELDLAEVAADQDGRPRRGTPPGSAGRSSTRTSVAEPPDRARFRCLSTFACQLRPGGRARVLPGRDGEHE